MQCPECLKNFVNLMYPPPPPKSLSREFEEHVDNYFKVTIDSKVLERRFTETCYDFECIITFTGEEFSFDIN